MGDTRGPPGKDAGSKEYRRYFKISFASRARHVGTVVTEVVPVFDGVELTDRIHRFERHAGMESREISYGGLISPFAFDRRQYEAAVGQIAP